MTETINTRFHPQALPHWAQAFPLVVRKCRRDLGYRVSVCDAQTQQMRGALIEQAQREDAELYNR